MANFRVQDLTCPSGKPVEIVDASEAGGHQGAPSRKPSGGFRPGAGRPKGRPNTSTLLRRISDDTLYVYEQLGGAEAFAEWAAANPDRFYPMLLATGKAEADAHAKNKDSADHLPRMIEIVEATPDGSPGRRTAMLRNDVVEELGLQVEDHDGREVATWPSATENPKAARESC